MSGESDDGQIRQRLPPPTLPERMRIHAARCRVFETGKCVISAACVLHAKMRTLNVCKNHTAMLSCWPSQYLLTARYRQTFTLRQDDTLDATIGIIDATDYLDENAYSNDEYTQFMNEALVNGPNAFLPSYDSNGALVWNTGPWSLRGVVMKVDENDDANDFTFYAVQPGYTPASMARGGTTG